tara:strand:+ start:44253 stop:44717 length:465 start_codon:yes stop_codon:yes gene_type:complete
MEHFDPLNAAFWYTIGMSIICGTIIGCEREYRGKPMGVRTSILICLSCAVFVHLGLTNSSPVGDPARVLGQIVTGVGFLGAGVILAKDGRVTGVTTAAVIWLLAAIGSAVGFGQLLGAFSLSLISVTVLVGIEFIDEQLKKLMKSRRKQDDTPS